MNLLTGEDETLSEQLTTVTQVLSGVSDVLNNPMKELPEEGVVVLEVQAGLTFLPVGAMAPDLIAGLIADAMNIAVAIRSLAEEGKTRNADKVSAELAFVHFPKKGFISVATLDAVAQRVEEHIRRMKPLHYILGPSFPKVPI